MLRKCRHFGPRTLGPALLMGAVAIAGPALAESTPSFDCTKTHTATEGAICKDQSLAWLDQQLNRLYGDTRQLLDETARASVRDEQRAWVGRRNVCGDNADCIGAAYWQRLAELEKRFDGHGITGPYTYAEPGFSGTLGLVEFPGNRAVGSIETVNLSRLHICTVDMTDLQINGRTLTWNDPDEDEGKHCRVDIAVGPGGAVINSTTCSLWCGVAAGFDGRYRRH